MAESNIEPETDQITTDERSFLDAFFPGGPLAIKAISAKSSEFTRRAERLDPVRTAATFGGLLLIPQLQSNAVRIETLIHQSIALGNGNRLPSDNLIKSAYAELGQDLCGQMEDPAEDLFVGLVYGPRGNFRVLGGTWEGDHFFTQRFVNIVESMPQGEGYDQLRSSIYALLTLSEMVCERAGLKRYSLGSDISANVLDKHIVRQVERRRANLRFTIEQLQDAGIDPLDLAPFVLSPKNRHELAEESLGNSRLERFPIARSTNGIYLVLPNAVGAAIRMFLIERMQAAKMMATFAASIANEYQSTFYDLPLLGERTGTPIPFGHTNVGWVGEIVHNFDTGRYLHYIFITDQLTDYEDTGLVGINPDTLGWSDLIAERISNVRESFASQPDFVEGLSLVVSCGVGRGCSLVSEVEEGSNWRIEFVSAHDLETLCYLEQFDARKLRTILEARNQLRRSGLELLNANGLLNLIAWADQNDGHVVPHGHVPDEFQDRSVAMLMMVTQNGLRELRLKVAQSSDRHVARLRDGSWLPVRKLGQSLYQDDLEAPLYGVETLNEKREPYMVFEGPRRSWWAAVQSPSGAGAIFKKDRWRTVATWLQRAPPVLDKIPGLPPGPILWCCSFDPIEGVIAPPSKLLSYEEVRRAIRVDVDQDTSTVTTVCSEDFETGLFHPENIAERALVDALTEGVLDLAGGDQADRSGLTSAIVQGPMARHSHAFLVKGARQLSRSALSGRVIKILREEDALSRIGLGWRVKDRAEGGSISGAPECIAFLNALVRALEDELIESLRTFRRRDMLIALLRNHEEAGLDRDRWSATSAAILALHPDRESTLATIAENGFQLNAVFQSTRILMEFAICESTLVGGRAPGEIDLGHLMSLAMLIFEIGGWSDAVRWQAMEPLLEIKPFGDVHANFGFVDEIIAPHARAASEVRIESDVDAYADNLEQSGSIGRAVDPPAEFEAAWAEQFDGTTLADMRALVDELERVAAVHNEVVVSIKRSALKPTSVGEQDLTSAAITTLLSALTSRPREHWRDTPAGFTDRDRHPWRFRRRLSSLRRPILQVDESDDPELLYAPDMLRESFAYMARGYYHGEFPAEQLAPAMKRWQGQQADRRGSAFSKEVAEALEAEGWQAEREVRVSRLLGRSFARDFGDVDVLAWRERDGRVLIIECKDVQYRKTLGEIAEQLADFGGVVRSNGKPDYLKRHLDRVDLIRKHQIQVASFTRLNRPVTIESHLVFRNPVPMEFALKRLEEKVRVTTLAQIGDIA